MKSRTCLLIPLFLAFLATAFGADIIDVGPFVDVDACYDALMEADDGDRMITSAEYVNVVKELGPSDFLGSGVEGFADLPLVVQGAFNTLACLCTSTGGGDDCCEGENAHISNEGADAGNETPDSDQTTYLFTVCLATDIAIEKVLESGSPSESPSASPSISPPTDSPTETPTPEPTLAPTLSPTFSPTPEPTLAPTVPPTLPPVVTSAAPVTAAPVTAAPVTVAPTTSESSSSPITIPTSSLVTEPTASPTTAPPTSTPSSAPSFAPKDLPVQTVFGIRINENNVDPGSYIPDLEGALDILVPQVVAESFPSSRLRRKLQVTVSDEADIIGRINITCPQGVPDTSLCEDIISTSTLDLVAEDPEVVEPLYANNLNAAIKQGRLQDALDQVNPNSPVAILFDSNQVNTDNVSRSASGDDGLSGGAIGGIVAGSVLVVAVAGVFLVRRGRGAEKDDSYVPGQELSDPATVNKDLAAGGVVGASQADYGKKGKKKSSKAFKSLEEGGDADAAPAPLGVNDSHDSSSNAGSSGWSSSAGVSSLNTGSVDSMEIGSPGAQPGATLAAIGAASAIAGGSALAAGSKKRSSESEAPNLPEVSRDDLDSAIDAGDWAAVGATAALLAAASDSQSLSSRSRRSGTSESRDASSLSSVDAARAAELDHLVDAGDWEGVVLAAARFEASAEDGSSKNSHSGSTKTGGSATQSSGYSAAEASSNSRSTSLSETPSKVQKRQEIREEVEALVRRVVPEEIDNVDEMMMQFKGREEELVETLRTMQERQVAQKAREQGQKQAKRVARQKVQRGEGGLPAGTAAAGSGDGGLSTGAAVGVGAATGLAAGAVAAGMATGRANESSTSDLSGDSDSNTGSSRKASTLGDSASEGSGKRRRTALELAIEAGDWEAVGEAAAMMSDTSITSASSGEIDGLAGESSSYSGDETGERKRRAQRAGVNAERAAELDEMIDSGNWTGVVAAANRFNVTDKSSPTSSAEGSQEGFQKSSSNSKSGAAAVGGVANGSLSSQEKERQKQLKEEQDALAQAEVWMAIAEQSKEEGETDVGASAAADWAIARSLSALKNAEAKGDLKRTKKNAADGSESASHGEEGSQDRSV